MYRIEQDAPEFDWSEWIDLEVFEGNAQTSPSNGDTPPRGTTLSSRIESFGPCEPHVVPQDFEIPSLAPQTDEQIVVPTTSPTEAHRTESRMSRPVIARASHLLTLDEEIRKSVNEPYASQLRYFFNYTGSTESILCLKRALCDLRRRQFGDNLVIRGAQSDADHLRIVKRLRENSAANSLLTMCHTVRLFQDDEDDLVRRPGSFVVQTPTSFDGLQRTAIGNPLNLNKAAITERKMRLLFPSLIQGSEEYQSERRYVTKLRQSAAKLSLFSHAFGFGILAFLPYFDHFGSGFGLNRCVAS